MTSKILFLSLTLLFSIQSFGQFDFGCTFPLACNYDPNADINDGSCIFSIAGTLDVTPGPQVIGFPSVVYEDIQWEVVNQNGQALHSGAGDTTLALNLACGCYGLRASTPDGVDWVAVNFLTGLLDTAYWSFDPVAYPSTSGTLIDVPESVATLTSSLFPCAPGCKDPAACNYTPSAELSDIYLCSYGGCNDPVACNYDPDAGCDNGSCVYDISCTGSGCVNSSGDNVGFQGHYANWSNGSVPGNGTRENSISRMRITSGNDLSGESTDMFLSRSALEGFAAFDWSFYTTDPDKSDDKPYYAIDGVKTYLNPDEQGFISGSLNLATTAGSILRFGVESGNTGGRGVLIIDHFSFKGELCGCATASACNYDPLATFEPPGACCFSCLDFEVGGGSADGEISWDLIDSQGNVLLSGGAQPLTSYCLDSPGCYWIRMMDSGGDGWNGASWEASDRYGDINTGALASGSEDIQFFLSVGGQSTGSQTDCTEPGSCKFLNACNYLPANVLLDIDACQFPECDDPEALNYVAPGCPGMCYYFNEDLCGILVNQENEGLALDGDLAPSNWSVDINGLGPSLNPAEDAQHYISGSQIVLSTAWQYLVPNTAGFSDIQAFVIPDRDITISFDFQTYNFTSSGEPYFNNGVREDLSFDPVSGLGSFSGQVAAGDTLGFGILSNTPQNGASILRITNIRYNAPVCGCTDRTAANYNANATQDNGRCIYTSACPGLFTISGANSGFEGSFDASLWNIETNGGNGTVEIGSPFIRITGNSNGTADLETEISITASHDGTVAFVHEYINPEGTLLGELPFFDRNGSTVEILYNSELTFGSLETPVNAGDVLTFRLDSDGMENPPFLTITSFFHDSAPCLVGCTYSDASNFDPNASQDDGSCEFSIIPCPADLDGDGSIATGDLLVILGAFGTACL